MEGCFAPARGRGFGLRGCGDPKPVPEKKPFHLLLEDVAMVDFLDAMVIQVGDERWSLRKLLCPEHPSEHP